MGGPSNKQKAAEANRRKNEANSAENETNWLSNKNADSKPAYSSTADKSAPIPSLDVEAMGSASVLLSSSSFLPVQDNSAATATPNTAEKFMAMIDAADDESKATIYSASVYLKMVSNAETEEGKRKNDEIVNKIFGPETSISPAPIESSTLGSHGNHRVFESSMRRLFEMNQTRPSAPVPDPWVLAHMSRSSSPATSSSPADTASEQHWRSGLTHDERAARLAELFEALETEEAECNLEEDQEQAESTLTANIEEVSTEEVTTDNASEESAAPTDTAVAAAQPAFGPAQAPTNPSSTSYHPSMTLRDLAALVKQFLQASASRFDQSSLCCVLEFSKAVEIFGQNSFTREPGQSRDVLRPGTIVFKYAQKAALPAGIFRWLQGIPDLEPEFKYPAATIVETVRQLDLRAI